MRAITNKKKKRGNGPPPFATHTANKSTPVNTPGRQATRTEQKAAKKAAKKSVKLSKALGMDVDGASAEAVVQAASAAGANTDKMSL